MTPSWRNGACMQLLLIALGCTPQRALGASGPAAAAAPRRCSMPAETSGGQTIDIPAGADLQAALNAARPGDTLSLAAGVVFVGPFTLPRKQGPGWIVVRGASQDRLPPAGSRVDPSHARFMPKLEADSDPVITVAPGAHHYRLTGIEIRPRRRVFLHNLVRLGDENNRRLESAPTYIVIDRCYVHGDPDVGARRGLAMNAKCVEVVSSYFSDFKEVGADSQAIASWNGPGPFRIVNNYLEAAGENVMFGGADPSVSKLVPSDIEILQNHFKKPLAWKSPASQGKLWSVKNIFELKNARRVLVEGNLFENNWVQAQSGFAILMTVRNQDGNAPWSVVEDVSFVNNVVRHTASGIYILGRDNNWPSEQTKRILIANNLFDDIGGASWGGGGTLLQIIQGAADVVVTHNTAFNTYNVIMAEGDVHPRFVFSNNIVFQNQYGIIGTDTSPGLPTLSRYFPNANIAGNIFIGADKSSYPPNNFFPPKLSDVGFAQQGEDSPLRLGATSSYRGAGTDGANVGVDVTALQRSVVAVRDWTHLGTDTK
jgi:hypothetical protein